MRFRAVDTSGQLAVGLTGLAASARGSARRPPSGVAASLWAASPGGPRPGHPSGVPAGWRAVRPARAAYSAALAVSSGDSPGSIQSVAVV